ncbi:MAG: phosphoheptose isomerase [Planctomycetes bacterium DG_23]|nr:MAG: phosphoheptose isomerase [Planctomycetes bacterium DG_23]
MTKRDKMDEIIRELRESARVKLEILKEAENIQRAADKMTQALATHHRIYLFGNGGSAADAQHIAGELIGRFRKERPALPVISLTTNTSALTAIANDFGFEETFARQVEALVEEGDVVVAISTSGSSLNVLKAVEVAKEKGAVTIGLTGASGGRLVSLVDICIKVQSDNTWHIQEGHITIGHILCGLIEDGLAKRDS